MKITKRQLKRIIREEYAGLKKQGLIKEVHAGSHYDKIATMICERDPGLINQGVELAIAMGYITKSSGSKPRPTHWNKDLYNHYWLLVGVDDGLLEALKNHNTTKPHHNHTIWFSRDLDGVSEAHIKITAHNY